MNLNELPDISSDELEAAADELFDSVHFSAPTNWRENSSLNKEDSEFKSINAADELPAWTPEELDAMSKEFTEDDIKRALATSDEPLRELLKAKDDE